MKKIKLLLLVLLSITLFCCSSDDSNSSNSENGFQIDGTFYPTDYTAISSPSRTTLGTIFPSRLSFFSNIDYNIIEDDVNHIGYFTLYSGDTSENPQLIEGTYTTNLGDTAPFAIGDDVIQFRDNVESENLFYSQYWDIDSGFESGNVTINSITNVLDENGNYKIEEIDISYRFRKNGREITGNYNGSVQYSDRDEVGN